MRWAACGITVVLSACAGCREAPEKKAEGPPEAAAPASQAPPIRRRMPPPLVNRTPYIPPQCFTRTVDPASAVPHNPCYACHTRSLPPNFTNDERLQLVLSLPPPAAKNPWTNLFDPPIARAARTTDEETLAYVRRDNYFDGAGRIVLRGKLAALPPDWDSNANGRWDGYVPDVWYAFDDHGFDHAADGTLSGWRAFAYYPFLGTFFPTNGSADDVLIRLDSSLQQRDDGQPDRAVYEINLAIVEALVTRADVAIDPADEVTLGVDLDLDGRLGTATRVAFEGGGDDGTRSRMQYVGRARVMRSRGQFFPIAPGLFPQGTEFFHTVRYLDVGGDGVVRMAPRMKEVRYAKKTRWSTYKALRAAVANEDHEQARAPDQVHEVRWAGDQGVLAGNGWVLQGFIEAADGSLRPQTYEETAYCEGCHAGVGATVDGVFSFARKLDGAPARGWFHWSQHDLRGTPEPRRSDGRYEYALYLETAGAGDELRENAEVVRRFFDDRHGLRPEALARLRADVSYLLLPSASRALDLDRAYRAIVDAQSFDKGREAVLAPSRNVYADAPLGKPTGVREAVVETALARVPRPR